MRTNIEIHMKIWRMQDLSKSAKEIHSEMWNDAAKALAAVGFECSLEELIIKQADIMDAVRRGE